jgi:ferredoxin
MVDTQHGQHPDPRFTTRPALDASHCMFCGLCVEVCPTGALTMGPNYELAGFSRDELYWSQDELMGYVEHRMQENPGKGQLETKDAIDKLLFPLLTPVLQFLSPHNYERAKGTHTDAYKVPSVVRQLAGEGTDEKELGLLIDGMSSRSRKAVNMLLEEMRKKETGPRDFSAWDYRHARRHEPKGSGFGETPPEEEDAA